MPYDRTLLSKAIAGGDPEKWTLRPEEYLKEADIEYKFGRYGEVYSVHPDKH